MIVTWELYDEIQKEAVRNYEKDGNDYIVETLDLKGMQELADEFKCKTENGLRKRVKWWAKLQRDVEDDIQNS
jgi:hypothetical protein